MGKNDVADVRGYVCLFAVAAVVVAALVLVFYFVFPKLRRKFFARFCSNMMLGYNKLNLRLKEDHFKSLKDVVSEIPALKNQGKFSLLEIGVGAGANLPFYPSNCILTVVDPNPHFEDYFHKHHSRYAQIEVDRFICAFGEDMKEVKDNSIDVVVTTLVLCSVKHVELVLKEIKRVLVPRGKFFFWEHVADRRGTKMRRTQDLLNIFWPYVFDGCEVNRDIGKMINNAGFSSCTVEPFYVRCAQDSPFTQRLLFNHIIGSHMRGTAVK